MASTPPTRAWARSIFVIALLAILWAACSTAPLPFKGTRLTAESPAYAFMLHDQFGEEVGLNDHRGKVVILTFLYTNCPDVCPITTGQLRSAREMLGDSADDIAIIAVSVDPGRDSVDAAHEFSERWDMTDSWSYLVGTEAELRPIWGAYYLDPAIPDSLSERDGAEVEAGDHPPAGGVNAHVADSYLVTHTAPIYLIDQDGRMRVVFTLPLETEDLVHDVRLLLR